MSHNEKSAWAMTLLSLGFTIWFLSALAQPLLAGAGFPPPRKLPLFELIIGFVVASIAINALLGILSPKDAGAGQDERDRTVLYKAGAFAGSLLGFIVVYGLWRYAIADDPKAMFAICLSGILIANTVNFALQVYFYRTEV